MVPTNSPRYKSRRYIRFSIFEMQTRVLTHSSTIRCGLFIAPEKQTEPQLNKWGTVRSIWRQMYTGIISCSIGTLHLDGNSATNQIERLPFDIWHKDKPFKRNWMQIHLNMHAWEELLDWNWSILLPPTRGWSQRSGSGIAEWWCSYHSPGFRRRSSYAVGIVVQHGVLDHGSKHKQEADGDKQIQRRHVGHTREWVPRHRAQRGHGQHSGDA